MPSLFSKIKPLWCAAALLTSFVLNGCISENRDDCDIPPTVQEQRQLLYFRVADVLTGEDVTATEQLDNVDAFLFDNDRELIAKLDIPVEAIRRGEPVDVSAYGLQGGYVSVWSNISNTVSISPVTTGRRMDDMTVMMSENTLDRGYFLCPGDMHFTTRRISFKEITPSAEADTVTLMRKNGRLAITVRGLEPTRAEEEYYFSIGALYTGYTFAGTPVGAARHIRGEGLFDSASDFHLPEPLIMVHHPAGESYNDQHCVNIDLYRQGTTRSDQIVASANRSDTGDFIMFSPGKTTNVLIELTKTGSMEVSLAITPWNEIHQWVTW